MTVANLCRRCTNRLVSRAGDICEECQQSQAAHESYLNWRAGCEEQPEHGELERLLDNFVEAEIERNQLGE